MSEAPALTEDAPTATAASVSAVRALIKLERERRELAANNAEMQSKLKAKLEPRVNRILEWRTALADNETRTLSEQHAAAVHAVECERLLLNEARSAALAIEAQLRNATSARRAVADELTIVQTNGSGALGSRLDRKGEVQCIRLLELAEALPLDYRGSAPRRGSAKWPQEQPLQQASPAGEGPSQLPVEAAAASEGGGDSNSNSNGIDEESLADVLGGAAQLVVLIAKLLSVSLRYPIRRCSSRSSIDEQPLPPASHVIGSGSGAAAGSAASPRAPSPPYPLYSRGVDPIRLQHGVELLGRNVQQLLHALGAPPLHPTSQIMPALHYLFQRFRMRAGV